VNLTESKLRAQKRKGRVMEELFQLKAYMEQGRYAEAMKLIEEMEEMSKDDKIARIESYAEILFLHLIKKHAEKRMTRSWEMSIRNCVRRINRINKRRKARGYYLKDEELKETLEEVYQSALENASLEAFEGQYHWAELAKMVDRETIIEEAFQLIKEHR
jgi:hypothetical protein